MCFHLYEVQEQTKQIYGENNQNSGCVWEWTGLARKGREGTSYSNRNILHTDLGNGYRSEYICENSLN